MNSQEVLAEFATDVREALKTNRTQDARTDAIVALVADLLAPGSLSAVNVPTARIAVTEIELGNARVEVDANNDLVRVEFYESVEAEIAERV